jgi:protein arginine kinase
MTIAHLLPAESDTTRLPKRSRPIQLTLRIRLARNLAGYSFPGWSCERQRLQVHQRCKEAIEQLPSFSKATHFTIEALDSMERQYLVERHLISRELAEGSAGSAVIVDDSQTIAVMINEEDHLRIQAMSSSDGFETLWKRICVVDDELEQHLD